MNQVSLERERWETEQEEKREAKLKEERRALEWKEAILEAQCAMLERSYEAKKKEGTITAEEETRFEKKCSRVLPCGGRSAMHSNVLITSHLGTGLDAELENDPAKSK